MSTKFMLHIFSSYIFLYVHGHKKDNLNMESIQKSILFDAKKKKKKKKRILSTRIRANRLSSNSLETKNGERFSA